MLYVTKRPVDINITCVYLQGFKQPGFHILVTESTHLDNRTEEAASLNDAENTTEHQRQKHLDDFQFMWSFDGAV